MLEIRSTDEKKYFFPGKCPRESNFFRCSKLSWRIHIPVFTGVLTVGRSNGNGVAPRPHCASPTEEANCAPQHFAQRAPPLELLRRPSHLGPPGFSSSPVPTAPSPGGNRPAALAAPPRPASPVSLHRCCPSSQIHRAQPRERAMATNRSHWCRLWQYRHDPHQPRPSVHIGPQQPRESLDCRRQSRHHSLAQAPRCPRQRKRSLAR